MTLKDSTGLWLTGDPLLAHINDTFHKLYQATSAYRRTSLYSDPSVCATSPFLKHSHQLSSIPLPDEILDTLRCLPSFEGSGAGRVSRALFSNELAYLRPEHNSDYSGYF